MPGGRPRRSAGTATPIDVLTRGFKAPSPDRVDADFQAVDAGRTIRLVCLFRATNGEYPRSFRKRLLDLAPGGMVIRPSWYLFWRRALRLSEGILDAHVRPRNRKTDLNVKAKGIYAEGQPFAYAGFEVITCRTGSGIIEFAVPRPDVPLMLYYLHQVRDKALTSESGGGPAPDSANLTVQSRFVIFQACRRPEPASPRRTFRIADLGAPPVRVGVRRMKAL